MSRALLHCVPFLAAATLSSCVLSIGGKAVHHPDNDGDAALTISAGSTASDEDADAKGGASAIEASSKADKEARELDRKLHFAELGLVIAELDAKQSTSKAERAVEEAQRGVGDAQRDLDLFLNHEQPKRMAEAQLNLDRSEHRRELAQDELNELISMYAAEEFAELTKELVLKRGRKSLEFAERQLELTRQALALLEGEELPKQRKDLELALAKAQHALRDAELDHERGAIKTDIALTKARNELEDVRREVDEAAAKAKAELEAEAAEEQDE